MDNGGDILQLCRLCLVKDQVNIPIFEEQGDIRQIFLKISSCLPVKVTPDDKLPKKICDGCSCKLDMLYEFWNTTANAEKQLVSWLDQAGLKANTETADQTMSVVAQQVSSKPSETVVKEEAADEIFMEEITFSEKWEEASSSAGPSATITSDEPPPKRARRAAAVRASLNVAAESDDEDDLDTELTKIEDESEDEDDAEVDDPSYVDAPSTSADDQPGPSGVGKDGGDAPLFMISNGIRFEYTMTRDSHDRTIFQCVLCPRTFLDKKPLRKHFVQHITVKSFPCDFCDKSFKTKHSKKAHINVVHIPTHIYKCSSCDKVLKTKLSFLTHLRRHSKDYAVKCEVCDAGFITKAEYTLHFNAKHGKNDNVCDICNKTFYDKYILQQHMLLHDSNGPSYQCELCDSKFVMRKSYRRHKQVAHSDYEPKRFICDICGKALSSKGYYNTHVLIHKGIKPHQCSYCEAEFTSRNTLKLHLRTHTGEKPYTCDICNRSFSQRSAYNIHYKKHIGPAPFQCQICDKRFVSNSVLNMHSKHKHKIIPASLKS